MEGQAQEAAANCMSTLDWYFRWPPAQQFEHIIYYEDYMDSKTHPQHAILVDMNCWTDQVPISPILSTKGGHRTARSAGST